MAMQTQSKGQIVEDPDGKVGRTYYCKGKINGKVPVYFEGEDLPMLYDPRKLKIKGYID